MTQLLWRKINHPEQNQKYWSQDFRKLQFSEIRISLLRLILIILNSTAEYNVGYQKIWRATFCGIILIAFNMAFFYLYVIVSTSFSQHKILNIYYLLKLLIFHFIFQVW